MSFIDTRNIKIEMVNSADQSREFGVLRLDLIHPVISGNKWFKLKHYLSDAKAKGKTAILTYGGAFSNHILATAAAARDNQLKSIGIIRGERADELSQTLKDAEDLGMHLYFISRKNYSSKALPAEVFQDLDNDEIYEITEGGYGPLGALGAMEMVDERVRSFHHIIAAVGTGTMLAGIIMAAGREQQVTGISVMKNNHSLENSVNELLTQHRPFTISHDYHFGGYAKCTQPLINFMNSWYGTSGIPTDFVYTGKLFHAVNDLINKKHFRIDDRILVVHSGGLQGNRSLRNGKLIF